MNVEKLSANALAKALKKCAEASDILDLPAWLIGSRSRPDFTYGVFLCSRELIVSILKLDDDLEIVGMLQSKNIREEDETLH